MSGWQRHEPRPVYGLLLACVITTVAVQGALEPSGAQEVLTNVLLGASLVLAFHVAHTSRILVGIAYALATAGILVAVLRASTDLVAMREGRLMSAAVVALCPPAVAVGIIRNLRASGSVGVEAVTGVLTLYMLIGMLFAFTFGAIDRAHGMPFFANNVSATPSLCLYFSFATLTTVGYGDLTAATDAGHTLAIFEALIGQIYLVTVVALIVSNLGRAHPGRT